MNIWELFFFLYFFFFIYSVELARDSNLEIDPQNGGVVVNSQVFS